MKNLGMSMLLLGLAVVMIACQPPEADSSAVDTDALETETAAADSTDSGTATDEIKGETMSEIQPLKATIATNKGDIHVMLYADKTPVTVANFVNLAQHGYYDGLTFHRVIPDFMIQGGCPLGTGTGGPGYKFEDECRDDLLHDRPGILSMANSGPGTNGSQFFITHVPTDWLNGKHTVWGAVVGSDDQDIVNSIQGGDKITKVTIEDDASALLASVQNRVDEWNEVLDN